ncbi:hypothetical protein A3Q34_04975 [Colwellia sp. PAMC 20917]|uniref:hypothetical protein n=1 Tax=Colwellia sp. PAMC 20917 TaxID=1816218 RepID=UPI00087846C8|nr:hypothetical protein [Colwellia sp. PAMC 20917]AOW76268.1 hypothetical protein A3Q34_04975 [Colwellia sp. PAMC 20917]
MKSYEDTYLVASAEVYGIYVMGVDEYNNGQESYWAYFYEGDRFVVVLQSNIKAFVKPSQLSLCKNEYDEELKGEALEAYIRDGIRAFREELPRHNRNLDYMADNHPITD